MALDQARECQLGHAAHTHFHHDRHLPSTTTAAADQTCILMDTEIEIAIVTVTERLGTDLLSSAEATSTHTFQVIASVNGNGSARGIGTGTVRRVTADTVVDRRLVAGCLTETGTMQETADSVTAFAEPAVSGVRRSEASDIFEKDPAKGIDLKTLGCQLGTCGARFSRSLKEEHCPRVAGIIKQKQRLRRRRHLFTGRERRR